MPAPLAAAAIGAGANLLGNVGNALSTMHVNKKQRQHNREMYDLQRQHALDDWNRNNEYNSPQAQMERLRQAGLNPNLVYGNGATTEASPIRNTQMQSWSPSAPQFDFSGIGNAFMAVYDMQQKQAQTDNIKMQQGLIEAEILNKGQQTLNLMANTDKTKTETSNMREMQAYLVEAQKASIEKLIADTQYTKDQNVRAQQLHPKQMQLQVETLKQMALQRAQTRAQTDKIMQDIETGKFEQAIRKKHSEMWEEGINPNDPIWMRQLYQLIERFLGNDKKTPLDNIPDFQRGKNKFVKSGVNR